jgi:hypothetical protein
MALNIRIACENPRCPKHHGTVEDIESQFVQRQSKKPGVTPFELSYRCRNCDSKGMPLAILSADRFTQLPAMPDAATADDMVRQDTTSHHVQAHTAQSRTIGDASTGMPCRAPGCTNIVSRRRFDAIGVPFCQTHAHLHRNGERNRTVKTL